MTTLREFGPQFGDVFRGKSIVSLTVLEVFETEVRGVSVLSNGDVIGSYHYGLDFIYDWELVSRAASSSNPLTRADILDAAKQAVTQDRATTHGAPEQTFGRIAAVWSARLGVEITPAQVCIMMIDFKACRAWGNPAHGDNWVDIAGYAACGGEIAEAGE